MEKPIWKELAGMGVAVAFALIAFSVIDAPPMTRVEVADWVQGIGSLGAVLVAVWVGTLPLRMQVKTAAQERELFIRHLMFSIALFDETIADLAGGVRRRSKDWLIESARMIIDTQGRSSLDKLLAERSLNWPTPELYAEAVSLRMIGLKIYNDCKNIDVDSEFTTGDWERRDFDCEHYEYRLAGVRASCAALLTSHLPSLIDTHR